MTEDRIRAIVVEAKRFLARADARLKEIKGTGASFSPSVANASLRRVSLDLTRSLAEMRRS